MCLGRRVTLGSRVPFSFVLCTICISLFHMEDRVARGTRVALP